MRGGGGVMVWGVHVHVNRECMKDGDRNALVIEVSKLDKRSIPKNLVKSCYSP